MQADSAGRTPRSRSSTSRWKRCSSASASTPTDCPNDHFPTDREDLAPRNSGRWDEPARRAEPTPAYDVRPATPPLRQEPALDSLPRAPMPRVPERAPAYQSLAREYDRVRGQEDSIAAVGKIAGELKSLREDLRQQMTTGLAREFDALRKDIQRAYASPLTAKSGIELGGEFERLSGAIKTLSEKTDDKSIKLLRLELEQVRGALDSLAREDTVRSVDRRWDDFDARFSKFEDRVRCAVARTHARSGDRGADVPPRTDQRGGQRPARIAFTAFARGEGAHAGRRRRSFRAAAGRHRQRAVRSHRGTPRRDLQGDRRIDGDHDDTAFRSRAVRTDRGTHYVAGPPDRGTG